MVVFLEFDIDANWAVVGAPLVGPDESIAHSLHRRRRREDVVDPPSHVPLARSAPLSPPRVMAGLVGMQGAKGVHPSRFEPAVQLGPLLGEKTAVPDIGFRAGQVDLAVGGIVIPDHEHRASAPQLLHPVEYRPIEVELVANPAVVTILSASLGEVAVDNHKPSAAGPEVGGDEPPLDVEPWFSEGDLHPLGLKPGVDTNTAVSPALGYGERGVPTWWRAGGGRDLLGQRANLLDADDVGSRAAPKVCQPPPRASANPVDVPAHDPHQFPPSDEHFTMDGPQLDAWVCLKSFQPRDAEPSGPPDNPGNSTVNFHGERRRNNTYQSTTDPEAMLQRKGHGKEAKLAYLGHVLLDNRHGLVANVCAPHATGAAEREAPALSRGAVSSPSSRERRTTWGKRQPGPRSHPTG